MRLSRILTSPVDGRNDRESTSERERWNKTEEARRKAGGKTNEIRTNIGMVLPRKIRGHVTVACIST